MGIILGEKKGSYIISGAPYQIILDHDPRPAIAWCREKFGRQTWKDMELLWKSTNDRWCRIRVPTHECLFAFANEEDYMEFVLRWL